MRTVRMLRQTAHGVRLTCQDMGELVRETPRFYVFRHPLYTAGEEKKVSQSSGAWHVEPCPYCPKPGWLAN